MVRRSKMPVWSLTLGVWSGVAKRLLPATKPFGPADQMVWFVSVKALVLWTKRLVGSTKAIG